MHTLNKMREEILNLPMNHIFIPTSGTMYSFLCYCAYSQSRTEPIGKLCSCFPFGVRVGDCRSPSVFRI